MVKLLFWFSIAAIVYTYIGYPLIIRVLARWRPRHVKKSPITPRISVVMACLNEEKNIGARIENLLQCEYPKNFLEIVVVSDGSTDRTVEVARTFAADRVRVLHYENRKGKPGALNLGVAQATGEIIVFADARQSFSPLAIKELAANFADSTVGAVSGAYVMGDRQSGGKAMSTIGEGVGLYWKYEELLRRSEARFHSLIGVPGAIYAIRRDLWQPLPAETILDDVYTPMQIAMRGYRVTFEANAVAYDVVAETAAKEFSRKVRTLMGNYQLCQLLPRLTLPTNLLLWQFFSHKLMRLAAPFLLLLLLVTNLLLGLQSHSFVEATVYDTLLMAQWFFYTSVILGWRLSKTGRRVRLFNVAYVFSVLNAAAFVGLLYFLLGKRNVWAQSE